MVEGINFRKLCRAMCKKEGRDERRWWSIGEEGGKVNLIARVTLQTRRRLARHGVHILREFFPYENALRGILTSQFAMLQRHCVK